MQFQEIFPARRFFGAMASLYIALIAASCGPLGSEVGSGSLAEGDDDHGDDGGGGQGGMGGEANGSAGESGGAGAGDVSDAGPADGLGGRSDAGSEGGAAGADPSDGVGDADAEGRVPMFIAQGDVGRTTISCDGGRTWIEDQFNASPARCENGVDCDHDGGAGRGIVFGDGWFFATFGWVSGVGERAYGVYRSEDGVKWQKVTERTIFAGLAYQNGVLLGGAASASRSEDKGATWTHRVATRLSVGNARRTGASDYDGGRFFIYGSGGGDDDLVVSSDGGRTFWKPTARPAACTSSQWSGGFASGNGVTILIDGTSVCRTTDGGKTFIAQSVPGTKTSHIVWTGDEFFVWSPAVLHRSSDGQTWNTTVVKPSRERGPVAHGNGTFVAVSGSYQGQRFERSRDGVTWTEATSYGKGHRIRAMAFGYGFPSAACKASREAVR